MIDLLGVIVRAEAAYHDEPDQPWPNFFASTRP